MNPKILIENCKKISTLKILRSTTMSEDAGCFLMTKEYFNHSTFQR